MKIRLFLSICMIGIMVSCSSEDDTTITESPTTDYFPLAITNSWSYTNQRNLEGQPPSESQETITVDSASEENGTTNFSLVSDNSLNAGLMTSILTNGSLAKTNGELIFNGMYQLEVPQMGTLELPINNVVVFNKTATAGTELYTFTDFIEQEIDVQGESIPVTFNYTISTENAGFSPNYSVNGTEYLNVLQANLLITSSVTALLGPIEVALLNEQEVLRISNYYADGIGLISSEAVVNYEFEDFTNFGLPQIPPIHIESSQKIDSYNIVSE